MSRVTKDSEVRRQEIIETARGLFTTVGYKETQIKDITREMNVAQGLIYHYFKSKLDILYAVLDLIFSEKGAQLDELIKGHTGSTLEVLHFLFKSRMENHQEEDWLTELIDDAIVVAYCRNKMVDLSIPVLADIIVRGNEDGSWVCEFPTEIATFISHGVSALLIARRFKKEDDALDELIYALLLRVLNVQPNMSGSYY